MGGHGPPPKPAHLRQRRNKPVNEATLLSPEASAENEVPVLPARATDADGKAQPWHPRVIEWWASVWRSPMASEYLDADMRGGLYLLADLHQLRWELRDGADLTKLAAEIRLQEVRFGLSPVDRSRLRWVISQGEEAAERSEARRSGKAPPKVPKGKDPRSILKMAG
jgi:hypothetical protein